MIQLGKSTTEVEKTKYEEMWSIPSYGDISPGADIADAFAKISGCKPGETLIDLGTGSGKAALRLQNHYRLNVQTLDITTSCMIPDAFDSFSGTHIETSLWSNWPDTLPASGAVLFDFAYCCDVMEHIPAEFTMLCLNNMFRTARHVFIQVDVEPEGWGRLINETLHLTVMPFEWWRDHIAEFGEILDCRDMIAKIRRSIFYVRSNLACQ